MPNRRAARWRSSRKRGWRRNNARSNWKARYGYQRMVQVYCMELVLSGSTEWEMGRPAVLGGSEQEKVSE
jgi:hypothetical protein